MYFLREVSLIKSGLICEKCGGDVELRNKNIYGYNTILCMHDIIIYNVFAFYLNSISVRAIILSVNIFFSFANFLLSLKIRYNFNYILNISKHANMVLATTGCSSCQHCKVL